MQAPSLPRALGIEHIGGALILLPLTGCLGLRLTVAPTIDTERNPGVEVRLNAELDFNYVHLGAGGGGGRFAGTDAATWQVSLGGSAPLPNHPHWLDLDLLYTGYYVPSLAQGAQPVSPYVRAIRGAVYYRHLLSEFGRFPPNIMMFGGGFFAEGAFREGGRTTVFGLPLMLQLLVPVVGR